MSRTCTICTHPQRAHIEAAIAAGTSYRHIASQFGPGYKSIERHAIDHIQEAIKQTQVAKEEAHGLDVVKQLQVINGITLAILQEARKDKMHALALSAIDRVQKQIELQAKLVGDIDKQQEQEAPDGLLIPYNHLSASARMEIRRVLLEDEQRKKKVS
jgi:hypothetical protein